MKKYCVAKGLGWLGALWACSQMPGFVGAHAQGIPEPSLIFYGTVRNTAIHNARVTSGQLGWRLEKLSSGRVVLLSTGMSNILGQFSYVLEVPCESLVSGPVSSNALDLTPTAALFDRSQVFVDGTPASFAVSTQATFTVSSRDRGRMERVDLTISVPCDDFDGNGICDDWEDQYFGYPGVDPNGDEDGDGSTNWEEYLAGTHPINEQDVFQFLTAEPAWPEGFRVEWRSAEGRTYSLLRSTEMSPDTFSVLQSNIVATPPANLLLDTNATPPGPYFYLLRLEL